MATTYSFWTSSAAGGETTRHEARLRLERLAWLMDSAFAIPGTDIRVGADAVLGLVPGLGNLATTAVSGYVIREAWRLGVPRGLLLRMIANVAVDSAVTAIPVLGNFADIFWKANRKNMALLAQHLGPPPGAVVDGEWRRMD